MHAVFSVIKYLRHLLSSDALKRSARQAVSLSLLFSVAFRRTVLSRESLYLAGTSMRSVAGRETGAGAGGGVIVAPFLRFYDCDITRAREPA